MPTARKYLTILLDFFTNCNSTGHCDHLRNSYSIILRNSVTDGRNFRYSRNYPKPDGRLGHQEPQSLIPYSQEPVTGPYPDLIKRTHSTQSHIIFIRSTLILSSHVRLSLFPFRCDSVEYL